MFTKKKIIYSLIKIKHKNSFYISAKMDLPQNYTYITFNESLVPTLFGRTAYFFTISPVLPA